MPMKNENVNRVPWLESLIERQADGLLHPAPTQGEAGRKDRRATEYDRRKNIEIEICLECTRKRCMLDDPKNEYCTRLRAEIKKRRKQHDKGNEGG